MVNQFSRRGKKAALEPPIRLFSRRGKKAALKPICPYGKSKIQSIIKEGLWRENLHFVTDHSGDRIYNLDLIEDWMANMNDPVAHQRACELYLASLPSNQAEGKTPKSQPRKVA